MHLRVIPVALYFILCGACSCTKLQNNSENSPTQLLSIIQYIERDYSQALSDLSQGDNLEYLEMKQLAHDAVQLTIAMTSPQKIKNGVKNLESSIKKIKPNNIIMGLSKNIANHVVSVYELPTTPSHQINKKSGHSIFQQNCASCHGDEGRGNGIAATGLIPPPTNFIAPEFKQFNSPFRIYNTINSGIAGTAMPSYRNLLSSNDIWNVSFYIAGLTTNKKPPFSQKTAEELMSRGLDFATITQSSDSELESWLDKNSLKNLQSKPFVNSLRHQESLRILQQQSSSEKDFSSIISFIEKQLEVASTHLNKNERREASQSILTAYLEGFEKIEHQLMIEGKKDDVRSAEKLFIDIRTQIDNNNISSALSLLNHLKERISLFGSPSEKKHTLDIDFWGEFVSSAVIILREGFEAFLIVMMLLSIASTLKLTRATRWIHGGWLTAILLGAFTYITLVVILDVSGAMRELVEAISTIIAVIMLFYTGLWLLSKSESESWQKFILSTGKKATSTKSFWALFSISFISVYRESFETILFYQGLINTAQSQEAIFAGFIAGTTVLFTFCTLMLWYNIRLPIRKFFHATGAMMFSLSIILAGKALYELIEGGYLIPTPLSHAPYIPLLGVFPYAETIIIQIFLIALTLIIVGKHKLYPKKPSKIEAI